MMLLCQLVIIMMCKRSERLLLAAHSVLYCALMYEY